MAFCIDKLRIVCYDKLCTFFLTRAVLGRPNEITGDPKTRAGEGSMRGRGQGMGSRRGRRWHGETAVSPLSTRLMEPALLVLLLAQDQHGYSLLDGLAGLGIEAAHPSVVYRVLREMEEAGWVSSREDRELTQGPPRRVYTLTGEGRAALQQWKQHLDQRPGRLILDKPSLDSTRRRGSAWLCPGRFATSQHNHRRNGTKAPGLPRSARCCGCPAAGQAAFHNAPRRRD